MEIPSSKGLFTPQAVNMPDNRLEITPGLVQNIGAMIDPQGTLLEHQANQAARTMAGITLEGLAPEFATKAHNEVNKYLEDYRSRLSKGQTAQGRYKLNYKDEIEMATRRHEVQQGIDWMKEVSKNFNPAIREAILKLEPEDAKQWQKDWEKESREAETMGDIPDPWTSLLNYKQKVPKKTGIDAGIYKTAEEYAKARNYPQGGEKEKDYDIKKTEQQVAVDMESPEWKENTEQMLIRQGVIKPEMNPAEKFNSTVQYIKSRNNPAENKKGGSTIIRNDYGVRSKLVPYVENADKSKSWIFTDGYVNYSKGEVRGFLVGVTKGVDGKFYGELSVPIIDDSNRGKIKTQFGAKILDKLKNGSVLIELDASDYGAITRKGLELEDAEKEGFKALSKQRKRTEKAEVSTTEADKFGI